MKNSKIIIGVMLLIILGGWIYSNYLFTNKPWWNGTKMVYLCAVNENSNKYGCYQAEVKSNGNEIISFNLPIAGGGDEFTSGTTTCGKLDGVRYCDFKDRENRNWEVKNTK